MKLFCKNPIYISTAGYAVDCGHCRSCRKKRRSEWVTRMEHEGTTCNHKLLSCTLTYKDEYIPPNRSLSKVHLQLFFKRLRKRLSKYDYKPKFKYFACGEYGPSTLRPHYHVVFFGLDERHIDDIFISWGMCDSAHFKCKVPDSDRGGVTEIYEYVCGYTIKKLGAHYNKKHYKETGRIPEFQLCSLGIGKQWCKDHEDEYKDSSTLRKNGKECVIPRYYRKILGIVYKEHKKLQEFITKKMNETVQAVSRCFKDVKVRFIDGVTNLPNMVGNYTVNYAYPIRMQEMRIQCDKYLENQFSRWRGKVE